MSRIQRCARPDVVFRDIVVCVFRLTAPADPAPWRKPLESLPSLHAINPTVLRDTNTRTGKSGTGEVSWNPAGVRTNSSRHRPLWPPTSQPATLSHPSVPYVEIGRASCRERV